MTSNKNNVQDIQLTKLETKFDNLELRVNKFIDNEFVHFKAENDNSHKWLIGLVILGILIPILLYVIK